MVKKSLEYNIIVKKRVFTTELIEKIQTFMITFIILYNT